MGKRSNKYREEGKAVTDSDDERRLQTIVQRITTNAVLTYEWIQVAKDISELNKLSNIELASTDSESSANLSQRLGRGPQDTLWDTSSKAAVLRCLVSENKVNVLVQLLRQFKEWQALDQLPLRVNHQADRLQISLKDIWSQFYSFERDAGQLLLRLFQYLEGLQQTNLQGLCQYISEVIRNFVSSSESFDEFTQEWLVFDYLKAIFKNISHFASEEVTMEWLEHRRLFPWVFTFLVNKHSSLDRNCFIKILSMLGSAAETDTFSDNFLNYFTGLEQKQAFIALRSPAIRTLIINDPSLREQFQPLLELIDKLELEVRLKPIKR